MKKGSTIWEIWSRFKKSDEKVGKLVQKVRKVVDFWFLEVDSGKGRSLCGKGEMSTRKVKKGPRNWQIVPLGIYKSGKSSPRFSTFINSEARISDFYPPLSVGVSVTKGKGNPAFGGKAFGAGWVWGGFQTLSQIGVGYLPFYKYIYIYIYIYKSVDRVGTRDLGPSWSGPFLTMAISTLRRGFSILRRGKVTKVNLRRGKVKIGKGKRSNQKCLVLFQNSGHFSHFSITFVTFWTNFSNFSHFSSGFPDYGCKMEKHPSKSHSKVIMCH